MIKLPSDAFATYMAQLPGSTVNAYGFLQMPQATARAMGNLTFTFAKHTFVLSPSAQLFPPSVAAQFGQTGAGGVVYSTIADGGTSSSGLDFTLGMSFLQRYYSAYDHDAGRVAFATTPYTFAKTSAVAPQRHRARRGAPWPHARAAATRRLAADAGSAHRLAAL
jgi:hypothetical protein